MDLRQFNQDLLTPLGKLLFKGIGLNVEVAIQSYFLLCGFELGVVLALAPNYFLSKNSPIYSGVTPLFMNISPTPSCVMHLLRRHTCLRK